MNEWLGSIRNEYDMDLHVGTDGKLKGRIPSNDQCQVLQVCVVNMQPMLAATVVVNGVRKIHCFPITPEMGEVEFDFHGGSRLCVRRFTGPHGVYEQPCCDRQHK